MAAGGGGGASRNSVGGSAGCSLPINGSTADVFQNVHPNPNVIGFPGGPVNYPKEQFIPDYFQGVKISSLSGGGGSLNRGGQFSANAYKQ